MQQKLTLRLDDKLIRQAKAHALRTGKSVSQIVAEYFGALATSAADAPAPSGAIPPNVRALRGALKGTTVRENEYEEYLEKKYR